MVKIPWTPKLNKRVVVTIRSMDFMVTRSVVEVVALSTSNSTLTKHTSDLSVYKASLIGLQKVCSNCFKRVRTT